MLNRLADRVRLRAAGDSPPPVRATTPAAQRLFLVGEEVRGLIDALRPDGAASVLIEGHPFLLRLPFHARAGEWVQLTVSAREPRLRFAMSEQPASASTPPPTRLSDAARFITALLAETDKLPLAGTPVSPTPLLPVAPAHAPALARALASALAQSGLFYESHLSQWVNGTRTLEMLRFEPQGLLPAAGVDHAVVPSGDSEADSVFGPATAPELPVHRDALAIVRQQLEILETRQLAWHGLIWPQQPMQWRIEERPSRAGADATGAWQARITLRLPNLGDISAVIGINATGESDTDISVDAARPPTILRLQAAVGNLKTSLRGAGVRHAAITIVNSTDTDAAA
jgi:Flagellar hook-length control protein FliK